MIIQNGASGMKTAPGFSFGPYSQGEQTNPADDALMAVTPPMAAGTYEVRLTIGASAAADFAIQQRTQGDAATVTAVILKGAAGQSGQYLYTMELADQQIVRVLMDDALTGTAAVALNLKRL